MIFLRKVPDGILPWSSVRPISVAATLYRTWAKMRAQQLLDHARNLSTATVQPCLSTRSIWGIQVELTAEFLIKKFRLNGGFEMNGGSKLYSYVCHVYWP